MIEIIMPRPNENVYGSLGGGVVGPLRTDGQPTGEVISLRSNMDFLTEVRQPQFVGDNDVSNLQVNGTVRYVPVITEMTPAPTTLTPDRVEWKTHYLYPADVAVTGFQDHGLVGHRSVTLKKDNTYVHNFAWTIPAPTDVTILQISVKPASPTVVALMSETRYTFDKIVGGQIYWKKTSKTWYMGTPGTSAGFDCTSKISYDQAMYIRTLKKEPTASSPTSVNYTAYACNTPYSAASSDSIETIDMLVKRKLNPVPFPIEDMHYGDLAMKASESINANDVNMIAFLRDLRHPTEMIPKLRELRNLKGLSNNYLTVKYGIMPTIDDLKTIMEAFKRRAPYLDKHGYSTYTAGRNDSVVVDDTTHTLEQHIKLAIRNEDAGILDLVNKIESAGFLPTLENLWDLVPYSFVIDWFVDVGGLLERADTMVRLLRYDIVYVTMSRKTTSVTNFSPSVEFPYTGSVEQVHYRRWVSGQCPVPPLSLQTTFQDFNHWLESSALLVQRVKH